MTGPPLLWCERCSRAEEAPRRLRHLPDFVLSGTLTCVHCGEPVTVLVAQIAPGGMLHRGRWTWTYDDLANLR